MSTGWTQGDTQGKQRWREEKIDTPTYQHYLDQIAPNLAVRSRSQRQPAQQANTCHTSGIYQQIKGRLAPEKNSDDE